jgi:hypothetical protein
MVYVTARKLRGRFEYIFEKAEDLLRLRPYLLPKLRGGKWSIGWVFPELNELREYLKTDALTETADLTIRLDEAGARTIRAEFPRMFAAERSAWDEYMDLLADFPVILPTREAREIFWRAGPRREDIERFLERLRGAAQPITMKTLDGLLPPKRKASARRVLKAFMLRERGRWRLFGLLSAELGDKIAFCALRKRSAELFKDKARHLNGEECLDPYTERINAIAVTRAHSLFSAAKSHEQLLPVMCGLENFRR